MQWTTATLLDRLLTKLEEYGGGSARGGSSGVGLAPADVMAKPEMVNEFYPKGSDLIVFLKEQIVREAMAPRKRPVTPAAKKAAVKRSPAPAKSVTSGDVSGAQLGTTTAVPLDLTKLL